jgi:hypothetical protein
LAANFRLNFRHPPQFSWDAVISCICNILSGYQYFIICLILCCKYLCIFSVFIYALCMRQYFWRKCFNLRFKNDVVVMIIWSIVIIINFVLTL